MQMCRTMYSCSEDMAVPSCGQSLLQMVPGVLLLSTLQPVPDRYVSIGDACDASAGSCRPTCSSLASSQPSSCHKFD